MGWSHVALVCMLILLSQAPAAAQRITTVITSTANQQVTVDLDPFPIRSKNFGVLVQKDDGSFASYAAPASRVYLGTVRDHPGAIVSALRKPSGTILCRISFESGAEWSSTGGAATVWDPTWKILWPTTVVPPTKGNSTIWVAEVGVDIPNSLYVAAGSTLDDAIDITEYTLINANAIYLRDASILHRVGKVVIRASSGVDPYTFTDHLELLQKIRAVWNGPLASVVGKTHHLAVMAKTGGGGGIAYVSTVGTDWAYAYNDANPNGDFSSVLRHEAGHTWGSSHYEGGGRPEGPTIMSDNQLSRFSSSELLTIINYKAKIPHLADPTLKISRPPRANMDTFTLSHPDGLVIWMDVIANDHDANFPTLKLASVSALTRMSSWAVVGEARDKILYIPTPEAIISGDSFSYRIENDQKKTSTGYVIVRPQITGWWKLDETSGTTAEDSSNTGATGTIEGSPEWNQGLVFGGNTFVSLGTKPSLSGTTNFSLSAWVKVSSDSRATIIQQRSKETDVTGGWDGEYILYLDGGRPSFMVFGDGDWQFDFAAPKAVNDGQWHHVAAVRDGPQGLIYVDGTLVASATGDVKSLDGNIAVSLGADVRDDAAHLTGTLASVRIFDRGLSGSEVAYLSTFPESLVGWWKMDEKTGSTTWDSSGNGIPGTITGSTSWDADGGLVFQGAGKVSAGRAFSLAGKVSFSVHVWVKVPKTASSTGVIIQQRTANMGSTSGWNGEYVLSLRDGARPNFMVFGDGAYQFDFSTSARVNDGLWHHIIAVRDGKEGRIYIDGLLSGIASGEVRSLSKDIGVHMGWDPLNENQFLTATLKDVRIYNRVFGVPPLQSTSLLVATS